MRVSLPSPWFTAQRGEGGAAVPLCGDHGIGAPRAEWVRHPPRGSGCATLQGAVGRDSGVGLERVCMERWSCRKRNARVERCKGTLQMNLEGWVRMCGGHWPLPPGPSKGWATVASLGGCGGLETHRVLLTLQAGMGGQWVSCCLLQSYCCQGPGRFSFPPALPLPQVRVTRSDSFCLIAHQR